MPLARSPSCKRPIATRTRRSTSTPCAASSGRMWRLRPSSRVISSQAVSTCASPDSDRPRRQIFAIDRGAGAQPCQHGRVGQGADLHMIDLGDVRGGVEQALGETRVVASSKQALARLVEAADRRHEGQVEFCQAVIDGAAVLRVVAGGDQAARLVDHQVDLALGDDAAAVDLDAVAAGIDAQRARAETIKPADPARPSATRISACLREHRPSFDSARQRLTPDGFAPALGEGRGRPVFGRGVIVLRDRSGKSGLPRQPVPSPGERFQAADRKPFMWISVFSYRRMSCGAFVATGRLRTLWQHRQPRTRRFPGLRQFILGSS